MPIRPALSEELRKELYNSPGFEKGKKSYPNIQEIDVLSDNDVVLRILPDLLHSPYDNESESIREDSSHVLLMQQNFGRPDNSSLEHFIQFFQMKFRGLLEELVAIVGHEIMVTEFLS